jgi:hypothetical protein
MRLPSALEVLVIGVLLLHGVIVIVLLLLLLLLLLFSPALRHWLRRFQGWR